MTSTKVDALRALREARYQQRQKVPASAQPARPSDEMRLRVRVPASASDAAPVEVVSPGSDPAYVPVLNDAPRVLPDSAETTTRHPDAPEAGLPGQPVTETVTETGGDAQDLPLVGGQEAPAPSGAPSEVASEVAPQAAVHTRDESSLDSEPTRDEVPSSEDAEITVPGDPALVGTAPVQLIGVPPTPPQPLRRGRKSEGLKPLLDAGLLSVGDTLHAKYKGTDLIAVIAEDGGVVIDGLGHFDNLSRAGLAAMNSTRKSLNGWDFWRTAPHAGSRLLAHLRQELAEAS